MALALRLAQRGIGLTWPNPSVGCVLVRDGTAVGRGWTQPGGRPHGETQALGRAGERAKGATAYVSLEPCDHWGRTPPCSEALIAAGVTRVVIAFRDPDPRVNGRGISKLRDAGLTVDIGLMEDEARAINAGFFRRVAGDRPLVTLKLAATPDGRIALANGESRWITGPLARARTHLMRARHDAILIGIETALADDPRLDCRLPGLESASPCPVVVDSRLRLPPDAALLRAGHRPVIVTTEQADQGRADRLREAGAEVLWVRADPAGRVDLPAALRALAAHGFTRLMVEGGGTMAAALVGAGLVDHVAWFVGRRLIGGEGRPALGAMGLDRLADAPHLVTIGTEDLDGDLLIHYAVAGKG